jgi:hypothetical protein
MTRAVVSRVNRERAADRGASACFGRPRAWWTAGQIVQRDGELRMIGAVLALEDRD